MGRLERREGILIKPDMQELTWKIFILQFSLDLAFIHLLSKALPFTFSLLLFMLLASCVFTASVFYFLVLYH